MKTNFISISKCLTIILIFFLSSYSFGQHNGVAWTAEYTGTYKDYHQQDIDASGYVTQAISTVISNGNHSILGSVTAITVVHVNEFRKNLVDFTETDSEGNSLFIKAVGREGSNANTWGADGIITGGSGKYLGASGTYSVSTGHNKDGKTYWSAQGILYLPASTTKHRGPEVYSLHEITLRPGVDPKAFEAFIAKSVSPIYNNMTGQSFALAKGDRGVRSNKYAIILSFDSIEDRNRIYPIEGENAEDWGEQEVWDKLNSMITGIGTLYTDLVIIK